MTAENLRDLLDRVAGTPGCAVLPPSGQPMHRIPADLRELYDFCGGARLWGWRLSGPTELVPASPRLLGEAVAREVAVDQPDDLTNGCYVIADGGGATTDEHVVIDLHPARAGRCYLAFWDSYGLVGEMPVVARSIPELLRWLLDTNGVDPTLAPTHGDAYG
ncbi:SMI1/KNR4 family protein [Asanoa hainanensis]|uniref:SMI1/KNR4 family protein n=1 Tax=Asanoa hainanensis TaxID=560556 RepID=UPI000B78ED68|nr:SMI1/KNR4 family protein [Asanoa hainanensis]